MVQHRIDLFDGWHLSDVRDGDQASFFEHLGYGEVSLAIPTIPHPYDLQNADAWVQYRIRARATRAVDDCLAIRDPAGKLFGSVGVDDQRESTPTRELGYWIGAAARGRGLASAAVAAFITYAIVELKLSRLKRTSSSGTGRQFAYSKRMGSIPKTS